MVRAYLGLGANVGDRAETLGAAIAELMRRVTVVRLSSLYETAPWGILDQPAFLNSCAAIETDLAPRELLRLVKDVEARLGRTTGQRWGPREIDIDVLLYDAQRFVSDELVVPHPRLLERAFALVPLTEIGPDAPIPGAGTVREALARLSRSPGDVRRVAPPVAPRPRAAP